MITLENILKRAQRDADLEQRAMTVWNLNRYDPLYVIRLARPRDEEIHGFVARVEPGTPGAGESVEDRVNAKMRALAAALKDWKVRS